MSYLSLSEHNCLALNGLRVIVFRSSIEEGVVSSRQRCSAFDCRDRFANLAVASLISKNTQSKCENHLHIISNPIMVLLRADDTRSVRVEM